MRNPVSKHDFNRGGWHRDDKNDYDRQSLKRDLELELDMEEESPLEDSEDDGESNCARIYREFCEKCGEIALKEYERSSGCICINSYS